MGLFLTCLSILLTYFSPTELLPTLAPFRISLVVMMCALVTTAAGMAGRGGGRLQSPQYLLVIGFWGAIVASHIMKLRLRWGLDAFLLFGVAVAIYFLMALNTFTLKRIKVAAGVMVACGTLMGFQAILAYHTGYLGSKLLLVQPGDPSIALFGNRVRGFGVLGDPNDFAQFLLVCVALLGLYWKKGSDAANIVTLGPVAAILLYASYLTFSRGGFLGLATVLFFSIYRKTRRPIAVAVAAVGSLVLYSLRFTGNRVIVMEGGRLMAWGAGIGGLLRHPLFGVGFTRFSDINDLTAHNSFVLCFAEVGLVGYFFWMALLLSTFMGISALAGMEVKTSEDQEIAGAVFALRAALASFLVTGFFLSRTYTETLYILLALSTSLIHLRADRVPTEKFRLARLVPRTVALEFASVAVVYIAIKARLF